MPVTAWLREDRSFMVVACNNPARKATVLDRRGAGKLPLHCSRFSRRSSLPLVCESFEPTG
eukprot:6172734-Amphidinium_carterae.2